MYGHFSAGLPQSRRGDLGQAIDERINETRARLLGKIYLAWTSTVLCLKELNQTGASFSRLTRERLRVVVLSVLQCESLASQ